MNVEPDFARQAATAATDPATSEATLRQGLTDAAQIIREQQHMIMLQVGENDRLRLWNGATSGLFLMLALASFTRWLGWW